MCHYNINLDYLFSLKARNIFILYYINNKNYISSKRTILVTPSLNELTFLGVPFMALKRLINRKKWVEDSSLSV